MLEVESRSLDTRRVCCIYVGNKIFPFEEIGWCFALFSRSNGCRLTFWNLTKAGPVHFRTRMSHENFSHPPLGKYTKPKLKTVYFLGTSDVDFIRTTCPFLACEIRTVMRSERHTFERLWPARHSFRSDDERRRSFCAGCPSWKTIYQTPVYGTLMIICAIRMPNSTAKNKLETN